MAGAAPHAEVAKALKFVSALCTLLSSLPEVFKRQLLDILGQGQLPGLLLGVGQAAELLECRRRTRAFAERELDSESVSAGIRR